MATAIQIQGPPAVVPAQVMQPQQPQPPRNLSSIKGLAVTQLVIGILTVIFGISAVARLYANTWTTNTGAGIWAGGWITITGIIGVCSARNHMNNSLNGVYMAFSIISTCVSALSGLFFIVAVLFYAFFYGGCYRQSYGPGYDDEVDCSIKEAGLGIHVPLLIMMVVEFFVSIIAAVYCCQNGCGNRMQGGIIIQPAQQVVMVTQPGNPAGAYPMAQYPQYGGQAMPQYGVPQYGVQQYGAQVPPQYSAQVPPASGQPQYPPQGNFAYTDKPPEYHPQ